MSSRSRQVKEELIKKQNGFSALTGRSLTGLRVERHHKIEKADGGNDSIGNQEVVTVAEHLYIHLSRALAAKSGSRRSLREMDIVFGRLKDLSAPEKTELSDLVEQRKGMKVKFY